MFEEGGAGRGWSPRSSGHRSPPSSPSPTGCATGAS